jgi:hypothetical protein
MGTIEASREEPKPVDSLEEEQKPAQTERQVFYREGTVIIRWLFGYYDERNLPGWTNPPRWPHTLSTCVPKKRRTRFRDVTFVGIDIDELREENGMPTQFHIGISILYTADLHDLCHSSSPVAKSLAESPRGNVIQSHHWIIEDPNYFSKNDNRFCFGKYRCVPFSDFKQSLEKLLRQFHPLILVCHRISRERITLRKLDIDLKPLFEIDTTKAARYPLQELHDSTLKKLMKDFEIPCSPELIHFAGNDAHCVLRVLLMIAAHDARKELQVVPAWVPAFEAVARAPLPPMPLKRAQKAAIKRRGKRDPV